MLLLRLRSTFIQCCSRDSQHRPQPHTPRFDEASDIELAQMSEPRINLDKCQREYLHYGSSQDGVDGTGGSLARRQCGASFVFATSKCGIACICFVPYRKPTLCLGIPIFLCRCSFPMLLPSILQVHGHKGCLTPFHGIEDRSI